MRCLMFGMLAVMASSVAPAQSEQRDKRDPNTPLANVDPNGEKQTGSNLVQRQVTSLEREEAYAVREAHAMAACRVNKLRSDVRAFLESTTSAAVEKADRALSRELTCSGLVAVNDFASQQSLSQSTDVRRGMLAEEMLSNRREIAALQPLPPQPIYPTPWAAFSGRNPATEEMAVCVAARNPSGIVALLRTTPETGQEKAAIAALAPWLGQCLVSNARLTANRQSIRAAVAEALYHRVTAPPETGAASASK